MISVHKVAIFLLALTFIIVLSGCRHQRPDPVAALLKAANETPPSAPDGCLFRSILVRQVSLGGGHWSAPQYIPRPGYGNWAYRYVRCDSWFAGHRVAQDLTDAGFTVEKLIRYGCGRNNPRLEPGGTIYVRTRRDDTWETVVDHEPPYAVYRQMEIGCFARSIEGDRCRCDQSNTTD
jgi:hypothetical protein